MRVSTTTRCVEAKKITLELSGSQGSFYGVRCSLTASNSAPVARYWLSKIDALERSGVRYGAVLALAP